MAGVAGCEVGEKAGSEAGSETTTAFPASSESDGAASSSLKTLSFVPKADRLRLLPPSSNYQSPLSTLHLPMTVSSPFVISTCRPQSHLSPHSSLQMMSAYGPTLQLRHSPPPVSCPCTVPFTFSSSRH